MSYELEFLPSALKEWQKLDKNLKYLLSKFTTTSQIQKILKLFSINFYHK